MIKDERLLVGMWMGIKVAYKFWRRASFMVRKARRYSNVVLT